MSHAALVTGAASGIGRAVAQRLTDDGYDVLAVDLEPDDGGPGEPFAADLATSEGNRDAVCAAVERFGRLDAVVANAGVQHVASIRDFPEERWRAMLDLMLTSPFLLAQHAWDALAGSPRARFVAIASAHGIVASPEKSAYVSAKHGVLGLIRTLALEGADDGILASAVCPGYVRTALVEKQLADRAQTEGISDADALTALLAPHAVKRLLEPSEVAAFVAFLLGDEGAGFSGAALPMDLGWTAR